MRKMHILLTTVSLSIVCPNLLAQIPVNRLAANLINTAPDTKAPIPNYNALPEGVNLLKNATQNPDGSLTIKAGQQTAEANEINRQYCASLGGIDVTNESDQTIGVGTLYSVACKARGAQSLSEKTPSLPGTNFNPFGKK